MSKTKLYILAIIFLCFIVGITIASIRTAEAETSTTFPVGEAGIAAYVKVDNIEKININALAEAYSTIEKQAESYVVGKVPVTNNPLVYVGLDGWIVAYFLNTEEASKIAGGTKTTTLEDAIDYMVGKIGVTYSTPIKYYDFEFPDANKMTIIVDGVVVSGGGNCNNFYVTVPGTLYEASYMITAIYSHNFAPDISLKVDNVSVLEVPRETTPEHIFSGYYNISDYFKESVTHNVILCSFVASYYVQDSVKGSTVLIYKN